MGWLLFLCLLLGLPLPGQDSLRLQLLPLDATLEDLSREKIDLKTGFPSRAALDSQLLLAVRQLHSRSYLEASVDTIDCRDSTCLAILHLGPRYSWTNLRNGNVPADWMARTGFRERLYRSRPFSFPELQDLQEELLRQAEDHGFPFARIWIDSLRLHQGQMEARLFMDPGRFIQLDSVSIQGEARISRAYLENYLGLRAGSPYSRQRILRSRDRLRELPFLQASADPGVRFREGKATVVLPLERRQASRFDFIVGVLPLSNTTGRMLITGNFEGELLNQFGLGERIYAQFEQLRPQTQELQLAFNYPYVLGLPFGADASFSLYRRDSSFLDLGLNLGFSLLFEGGNYLKAFYEQRISNLLTVDENRLLREQRLPDPLDVRVSNFGMEGLFQQLDYRFNPRRGWSALLRASAGIKRIPRNSRIESLELGFLYDTVQSRSFQYRLLTRLEGYLPLFSRSTLKGALNAGFLLSEQAPFQNELFRLGGNRLLRGFDEEFFFAGHYAITTLEYRLLIGQNSYLYVFGDGAWLSERKGSGNQTRQPFGFGSGITFETKVGLFGVSLAFGTLLGEPVDFARPKVHFGYVSLF